MTIALKEFRQYCNPNKNKLIILLLDQAGWHTSADVAVDKTIRNFPLLPYTPKLQPVECTWPLLKESVANKAYASLDELEAALVPRCQWLNAHPEVVKGVVGFEWIQKIERRIN